jgi:UDP-glucose 4-epimerase
LKKVAVTGANGFIGGYLVAALLQRGYRVLCIGRSIESMSKIPGAIEKHATDYSANDLTKALEGSHSIVHLAGRRSVRGEDMELVADFAQTGLKMLDGLLRAALQNNIEQVIQASSIAVYSPSNKKPFDENEYPIPASNYGLAKLFCEQYADWWSARHNIPVAHLRIAACYGAGEKLTPALMSIADKARRKEHITVNNAGLHAIDQIYVEDVVEVILKVLQKGFHGPVNIGSACAISVREIAELANEVFGNTGNLTVGEVANGVVFDDKNHLKIDGALEKLDWTPSHTVKEGLQEMRRRWNNS